ncbi:MAG: hypothetical protein ACE5I7_02260 [Candidatus Binatia bacterium]
MTAPRGPRAATRDVRANGQAPAAVRHRTRKACLLGCLCFGIYLTNLRPMGAWDSIPARLLPFSILHEGNLDLDEFGWLRRLSPSPYFLRHTHRGHWLSGYPIAVAVLVTPLFVPAAWWLYGNHVDHDDVRFRLASVVMERIGAAAIAAVSVSLVFFTVCTLTSAGMATAVALVYGLGTSTWAIGSQALWQHGLAEVAVAGISLFLVARDTRRNAVAAGGFAALAVLARPTMIVFALLALVFMWRERRGRLLPFLSLPIAGMVLLFAYNLRLASVLVGGYASERLVMPRFKRLAGLLVSPSRGLFIYTPVAALVLPAMVRRFRGGPRWLAYLPAGIAGYVLLYSSWQGWWGGQTYGPRFLTDVLPAIVLCTVPIVERLWQLRVGRVALVGLTVWGLGVQGIGVYCDDRSWNQIGSVPQRLWDWSDPQIVRAARAGWHGTDLAPLVWQALTDPRPVLLEPLSAAALAGAISMEGTRALRYGAGSRGRLTVRVTNRSDVAWPAFSDYGYLQCKLAYRWWSGARMLAVAGGIALPRNLAPGESARIRARVQMPAEPGSYELELMLVQVLDVDKGASGGTTLRLPVEIE